MDDLLLTLVKAANQNDFSLDITLNVNGALVTGTTVSAQKYLESISRTLEDGNETSQEISQKLSKASQSAKESAQGETRFVHLKDAQVYNGDSQPTPSEEKFYWRGKAEEVDGFFLGKIDARVE
ncbi:gas vesicle accessory protein GvpU [Halobacillus sp. BBL2006]|uniref:gas vesicle accessory protein GvpU n=1 Tax=Halobacillus sp. BBL2006 TaxID=1543706 RepID=UPI0005443067|nr:gas vesicle accessory protein GvpU [Halobacillus sp. BBL2006]KHE72834.1 gas vesicle protein GvpU [Halobacillus sp. BBL2006]